ncbi:MAG TPA: metalloregulator ArsR/SmtB family transcription factor [Gemmatimonadales bacterium]
MASRRRPGGRDGADDRLDRLFRALGDRTRRALLARLARRPAMVTELARPFAMSLPAVSRHIRVLERARLVVRTVDGRVHRCALDAAPLETAEAWLSRNRRFWSERLDALARYVERSGHRTAPGTGRPRDRSR